MRIFCTTKNATCGMAASVRDISRMRHMADAAGTVVPVETIAVQSLCSY